jgi:hypothetical protein
VVMLHFVLAHDTIRQARGLYASMLMVRCYWNEEVEGFGVSG